LRDCLAARGISSLITREPGGSALAEAIRDLILRSPPVSSDAEFLLFAAARAEHIAATIQPAMEAGQWVICDRYMDSTRVYQGALGNVSQRFIRDVENHALHGVVPDLTVILDMPVDLGMARTSARGNLNRFDEAGEETHTALRQAFLDIARAEPDRCRVIDASRTPEQITDEIMKELDRRGWLANDAPATRQD
jgi:dTMP kinase